MIVESAPRPGVEEEAFHRWYSERHVPALLSIPGFVSARRYRRRGDLRGGPDPAGRPFLAVYELEADDLAEPLAELAARSAAGRTGGADALQTSPPPVVTVYELLD